ncbi:MAG: arylsulfatase, partial [Opitutaceae bacterium]
MTKASIVSSVIFAVVTTAAAQVPPFGHSTTAQTGKTPAGDARPNILIIMSDDMGFSDVGCYGGEINTPNLDSLAANGLRFTQFYNTGRCCPTRASLLTGLYPHQAGVGHMMADRGHDGYRGDLNAHCVTIAEVLRPAGYATYALGKWHVTKKTRPQSATDQHNWPLQRGFDRYYGTLTGAGSYYDPSTLVRNNTMITAFNDPEYRPERYYYTDAISDNAVRFIAEHKQGKGDKPFFMYIAYTAAHWPMHALEKDIAKHRGKYDQGYEPIRRARREKAVALGLVDPKWPISPPSGEWDKVQNRDWEARGMEVYAAMIDSLDQGIGRIVAELKRQQQFDNTLIIFLQDNGGAAEEMGRRAQSPNAPTTYTSRPDNPVFQPLANDTQHYFGAIPKQTRDGWPVIMGPGILPGGPDTFIAYGRDWANVSNTPFREYKTYVHEGGISTPLIVHWPAGMKIEGRREGAMGRLCSEPSHLIDIMAACVDLAEAKYPAEFAGAAIHPMEGRSLMPLLVSPSLNPSFSP